MFITWIKFQTLKLQGYLMHKIKLVIVSDPFFLLYLYFSGPNIKSGLATRDQAYNIIMS